ncbi:MAG: hypothetical protein N3E50_07445 [Candidatus Goldbacteria bacterium]|nr:hypothetical protein [Candidatus Goldiibacteriota bacterium]
MGELENFYKENNIKFRCFYLNLKEKIKNINLNKRHLNEQNKFKLLLQTKLENKDLIEI